MSSTVSKQQLLLAVSVYKGNYMEVEYFLVKDQLYFATKHLNQSAAMTLLCTLFPVLNMEHILHRTTVSY